MQLPSVVRAPRRVRVALAVLCGAIVLWGSIADPSPGMVAPRGPLGLVGMDKWLHGLAYAALTLAVAYALWATTVRSLAVTVGSAMAYGFGIEVLQSFHPLRAFGPGDLLANAVGALLAAVLIWLAVRLDVVEIDRTASPLG